MLNITHSPQWALLDRTRGMLIMRGSWATVRAFGERFGKLGIQVDYRRELVQTRKVA